MTPKTTIPRTTHQKALNAAAALNRAAMKLNNAGTLQSILSAQEDCLVAREVLKSLLADLGPLVTTAERDVRAYLEEKEVLRRVGA